MAVLLTAWLFYISLWILRRPILVHAKGKPKFRGEPQKKYSAFLDDSVRLKCPVSGTDAPPENRTLVAWFKKTDNKWRIILFNYGGTRFLKKSEKHLKILDVKKEDAGTYLCIGKNEHGSVNLTIELQVQAIKKPGRGKPPKFKKKPKRVKMTFRTGETAKLQCHSTGDPDPNVQWFKDGKSYGVEKRTSVGADGWTLNLRYLTVDDTGDYTCRVSNNVGSINRTFSVHVKARTFKPIIDQPDKDTINARHGRVVKFECKATSVGELTFSWQWASKKRNSSIVLKPNSKYIKNYTKTHEVSMNLYYFDGFLVIKDVKREDEGTYTCLVKNNYGIDKMDFHLYVKEKEQELTTPKPMTVVTSGKAQTNQTKPPIVLVAVLAASIVAFLVFIAVLVICCFMMRKNLEKQYVNVYRPQDVLFQPYSQQISVHQEMEKRGVSQSWNGNNAESVNTSKDVSLHTSRDSIGADSKKTREPSSSSELCLANSLTSLQTTLRRSCPGDNLLNKGSTNHSVPQKTPGTQAHGMLCRGDFSPVVANERQNWESESSLDDSPRNTSPQRSRESIV